MIDKVIHYFWFGGNPKDKLVEKCIESWKKYCPDYKIIEWNESNFDINLFRYASEAYEQKKYGFVTDPARFYIIYNYGGIYLDTDVELKESLDEFLKYKAWFNWESNVFLATGLGFGAEQGNNLVKAMLDYYVDRSFYKKNGKMDLTPSPKINTRSLLECNIGLIRNGATQIHDNVLFCSGEIHSKKLTHHYAGSWIDNKDEKLKYKQYKDSFVKRKLRDPKLSNFIEQYAPNKVFDLYILFSYDVLDNGILYFVRRKLKVLRKRK